MSRNHRRIYTADWQYVRRKVLQRDGYVCQLCGSRSRLEVDHVVPLQEGGPSHIDNLQCLCRNCHIAKTRRENGGGAPDGGAWERYVAASRYEKGAHR